MGNGTERWERCGGLGLDGRERAVASVRKGGGWEWVWVMLGWWLRTCCSSGLSSRSYHEQDQNDVSEKRNKLSWMKSQQHCTPHHICYPHPLRRKHLCKKRRRKTAKSTVSSVSLYNLIYGFSVAYALIFYFSCLCVEYLIKHCWKPRPYLWSLRNTRSQVTSW